jgi:hypothetical protein
MVCKPHIVCVELQMLCQWKMSTIHQLVNRGMIIMKYLFIHWYFIKMFMCHHSTIDGQQTFLPPFIEKCLSFISWWMEVWSQRNIGLFMDNLYKLFLQTMASLLQHFCWIAGIKASWKWSTHSIYLLHIDDSWLVERISKRLHLVIFYNHGPHNICIQYSYS